MPPNSGQDGEKGESGMIEVCCGALGALAVLAAFLLGTAVGKQYNETPARGPAGCEESEEEKRLLHEEQQAFEDMLHYNMDTAYCLGDCRGVLTGGESR